MKGSHRRTFKQLRSAAARSLILNAILRAPFVRQSLILGAAVSLIISPVFASAYENPLKDPALLNQPRAEVALSVRTARVMYVDYDLVRRDFPSTLQMSHAEIDELMLRSCGAFSNAQSAPNRVNTKIEFGDHQIQVFRPRGYGRALVFPFLDGLMDGKGAGAVAAEQKGHSNGLASVTETLRELLIEKLIKLVMQNEGYRAGTVESYGVIDYGFDIVNEDGTTDPAGLVLRQAHVRGTAAGRLPVEQAQAIERILRKYGIFSDHDSLAYDYQTIDRQNVQASATGSLFDFGSYRILPVDTVLNSSPVQPDPDLRVPAHHWAAEPAPQGAPVIHDQLVYELNQLVKRWRSGEIQRDRVDAYVEMMLGPARRKYAGTCSSIFGG